jgi:hypothetical protein
MAAASVGLMRGPTILAMLTAWIIHASSATLL